jgi:hypothetical protein
MFDLAVSERSTSRSSAALVVPQSGGGAIAFWRNEQAQFVGQRAVRGNDRRRDAGRNRARWFREQVERAGHTEAEERGSIPGRSNCWSSGGGRACGPDRIGNKRHDAYIPGRCRNWKTGSRG